jgi:hypothetical protein
LGFGRYSPIALQPQWFRAAFPGLNREELIAAPHVLDAQGATHAQFLSFLQKSADAMESMEGERWPSVLQ